MHVSPELLKTDDGSDTLRHPLLGDYYHSTRGAVGEAQHIFIRAGFDFSDKKNIRIFEVGFGSGLNALLTLQRAAESDRQVKYQAVELYPVASETVQQLNYTGNDKNLAATYRKMHDCPWNEKVKISDNFSLKKIENSLLDIELDTIFDVIYFDAFAPETQPEMWSEEVFSKLYAHTAPGGILVTYSSKGEVKRALRAAGYEVKRLEGALGKRHMVRAQRIADKQE